MRPLSFIPDPLLSDLLSVALAIARRRGGHYDAMDSWHGPALPLCVALLVDEYRIRRSSCG